MLGVYDGLIGFLSEVEGLDAWTVAKNVDAHVQFCLGLTAEVLIIVIIVYHFLNPLVVRLILLYFELFQESQSLLSTLVNSLDLSALEDSSFRPCSASALHLLLVVGFCLEMFRHWRLI